MTKRQLKHLHLYNYLCKHSLIIDAIAALIGAIIIISPFILLLKGLL